MKCMKLYRIRFFKKQCFHWSENSKTFQEIKLIKCFIAWRFTYTSELFYILSIINLRVWSRNSALFIGTHNISSNPIAEGETWAISVTFCLGKGSVQYIICRFPSTEWEFTVRWKDCRHQPISDSVTGFVTLISHPFRLFAPFPSKQLRKSHGRSFSTRFHEPFVPDARDVYTLLSISFSPLHFRPTPTRWSLVSWYPNCCRAEGWIVWNYSLWTISWTSKTSF